MDSTFLQWIAATDVYARKLAAAARGDAHAFADLRHLAADVQQHSGFAALDAGDSPSGATASRRPDDFHADRR